MRKRKKEIALKGNGGIAALLFEMTETVKVMIFPHKARLYLIGEKAICPAMSRREIRNVAIQICKNAFAAAKYRGY